MTEIRQKTQKPTEETKAKQLPRNPNDARYAAALSANEKYRYLKKFIKKGKHNAHILDYTGHTFGLTYLSEDGERPSSRSGWSFCSRGIETSSRIHQRIFEKYGER